MTAIDWSKPLEVCRPFVDVKVLEPYWVSVKRVDGSWVTVETSPDGSFECYGFICTNGIRNVCPVSEVEGLRFALSHLRNVYSGSEPHVEACRRLLERLESDES